MAERRAQVIGAGGHAKVVIATLRAAGHDVVAVWDDAPGRTGTSCLGAPVVGRLDEIDRRDVPAVIAVGDNRARGRIAATLALPWLTVVHPHAYVDPAAVLGPGTVVFAGAVVQPDAHVGAHVIINTAASVDHDCVLGDFVHLGPGAHLCGNVAVHDGALVGVGACARPGVTIGAWGTVGAGAAVVSDVAADATVVGLPARAMTRASRA